MTFNNANRKHLRNAEKETALAEANRIAFTRTIMSTLAGRAWMHDLLLSCSIFRTPFVRGAPDATAFNCGSQNIALRIFGDVAAHCPNEYTLMMSEANVKDLANDRRNSESSFDPDTGAGEERNGYLAESTFAVDADGFVHDDSRPEDGAEGRAEDDGTRSN